MNWVSKEKKHLNSGYSLLLISQELSADMPQQWLLIIEDVARMARPFKITLSSFRDWADKFPDRGTQKTWLDDSQSRESDIVH